MKLAEYCREAETRLQTVRDALSHPTPEDFERCLAELRDIAIGLQTWISSPQRPDEESRAILDDLRRSVSRLNLQAERGAALCLGWMQISMGAGYTSQGQPFLLHADSQAMYEA
jgi:hypothetical protein